MQGNVLSSSTSFFDVHDEAQVIALLKRVRHSTLDNETKDDIRDIIFELQTNYSDALLAELELFIEPLEVHVVADTESSVVQEVLENEPVATTQKPLQTGRTRPVPRWTPSVPKVSELKTETVLHSDPEPVVAPLEIQNVGAPVDQAVSVSEEVIEPQPIPEAVMENSETIPEVNHITVEAAQARIADIKHVVNDAVGNPVNLIDANNTVGRAYMNALLEAMKAVANGGATLDNAMQQLETAFKSVQEILPQVTANSAAASEDAEVASHNYAVTNDVVMEEATPAQEEQHEEVVVPPLSQEVKMEEQMPPQIEAVERTHSSVAAVAETLRQQQAASRPQEVKVETPTDPLMSSTITAGLEQLLNEWKLFKSSGLFGTGPSGINHPLYGNLRNISMNLVVTGRFEGATPDVRQSITDYMNGWRYEQGMTHDMQETFEHYLRRVIKAIVDKRASTMA